jgi:tetratricopeptide (TPR) repeat protein
MSQGWAVNRKLYLFLSYAHEDRALCEELQTHLAALRQDGTLEGWNDRDIPPGATWEAEIRGHLDRADIILLLVSADYRFSAFCGLEVRWALERAALGKTVVIPVILRPVDWEDAPFHHLQALPDEGRPVVKWRNRDEAFVDIVRGIRRVSGSLLHSGVEPAPVPGPAPVPVQSAQDRVLDAAMAPKVPMGKPADLAVMVRRTTSAGLKAVLEVDDEYSSRPEDVRSKPFRLEFPLDPAGHPAPTVLTLKLESPDFDPPRQVKPLEVPPDGDSEVCTFLLTPLFTGELIVNLEVHAGPGQQASRVLRILAEASDRVVVRGRMLVSVPISTVVSPQASTLAPMPAMSAPASASPQPQAAPPPPAPSRRPVSQLAAAAAALVCVSGVSLYYFGRSPKAPQMASADLIKMAKQVATPPGPDLVSMKPVEVASAKESWQVPYNRGIEALKQGQPVVAVTQLLEAAQHAAPAESRPAAALAAARLSLAARAGGAAQQRLLESARADAGKAVQLQPSAENYLAQGLTLERSGKLAEAESALRRSIALNAAQPNAWYALGMVLHDSNKPDEAISALRKAVQLDPGNNSARLLLATLLAPKNAAEAKVQVNVLLNDKNVTGQKADVARRLAVQLAK